MTTPRIVHVGGEPHINPPGLVMDKESGTGVRIDPASPDYGWADILGLIRPDPLGGNAPTAANWRGSVRQLAYSAGDQIDCVYHIPHDYVPGTNIHAHLHWGHHGTAISGSFIVDYYAVYSSRDGVFGSEVAPVQTISTPDVATIPQHGKRVNEFQLTASSPTATQLDTDDIEVDGIVLLTIIVDTIPTITGGVRNEPFIFTIDLHYQTSGLIGTKSKDPDFYT